jgi:hypothetical protein
MERDFRIEPSDDVVKTGQFPAVLFTNGEASDGHIVDIRGLEVDDRVPLFRNHDADPATQLGSLVNPRKTGKTTRLGGASLRMDGMLALDGDGENADIRRDVALLISRGDITGMSGRWDVLGDPKARASLDKNHYAYKKDLGGFHTPMFFERARVLEGSIVGIGADSAALIGRSGDTSLPAHVRDFYRGLVGGEPVALEEPEEEFEDVTTISGHVFQVPADLARYIDELETEREEYALRDEEEIETEAVDVTVTEGPRLEAVDVTNPALEVERMARSMLGDMLAQKIAESDKRIAATFDAKLERVLYQKLGVYTHE